MTRRRESAEKRECHGQVLVRQAVTDDHGIGSIDGPLAPGESVTYKIGFGRSASAPFEVSAMAPVGYDVAVFR